MTFDVHHEFFGEDSLSLWNILVGVSTYTIPFLFPFPWAGTLPVTWSVFVSMIMIIGTVMLFGAIIAWLLVYGLNAINHPWANRILPPSVIAVLIMGIIIANALGATSVYLRAHKKEPYMIVSAVVGICTGLSALLLGRYFSAMGICLSYLLCNLFIAFPWSLVIFFRCRKQWHCENMAVS